MYTWILLLHLLGAAVWTGGHLVLALGLLPQALKARDPQRLLAFERVYERIGLPALLLQIVTGLWLAARLLPPGLWLADGGLVGRLIVAKLLLLAATAALALHARLRLIPGLTAARLPLLAWHIAGVTAFSVLFVAVGVAFRTGGFF